MVFVEPAIHLVAVAGGRQIPAVRRHEADPGGGALAGGPVDDLDLDRHAGRWEQFDRPAAPRLAERAAGHQVDSRDRPVAEAQRRVGRQRQVDDPRRG